MNNENSRIRNALLGSLSGIAEQAANYLGSFIFRTVFLYVLSSSYLGISTLFTNILQVFSLTELGIGSVIAFNMYKPMKEGNAEECSALLGFYRRIYRYLAGLTLLLGCAFYPFLGIVIADHANVPSDVNLNLVYWLFVFQSASSYLCVYVQSLLNADQKGYVISSLNTVYNILSNLLKIVFLLITANYTLVLFAGIILGLFYNIGLSLYIKKAYSTITALRCEVLPSAKRRQIFKDTAALMCHKVGYVIMNSTDSIILSAFIGVSTLGYYSNYQLISVALDTLLNKVFGGFIPTIGNALLDMSDRESFLLYRRLRFMNIWAAAFCAICFYLLIEPFIELWLGDSFVLEHGVAVVMSLHFFWNSSRVVNAAFVNASGLFVKDKIRPLIQSVLNLVISIVLVVKFGIIGVFIGTLVSTLVTAAWREGFILYKNIFHIGVAEYFSCYFSWFLLSLFVTGVISMILAPLPSGGLIWFIARLLICVVMVNLLFAVIMWKNDNTRYLFKVVVSRLGGMTK